MDLSKISCLSVCHDNIVNVIACNVNISFHESLLKENQENKTHTCTAIWDTGAINSAITTLQVKKLDLVPVGKST